MKKAIVFGVKIIYKDPELLNSIAQEVKDQILILANDTRNSTKLNYEDSHCSVEVVKILEEKVGR